MLAAVDEEMSAPVDMDDDSNQPSDEDRSPSPTPVWLNCGQSHLPASPIDFDPYCPLNYTCTGHQDGFVWFDGKQGSKDMEFIIDLEGGSMDKLADVRPFLYHMGYFSLVKSSWVVPDPFPPGMPVSEMEDLYVKAGREYLLAEKKKRNGYFLGHNDWSVYNADPEFETMPYAAFMQYSAEGEEDYVGFDHYHQHDTVDQVVGCIKTNVRVALPDLDLVLVKPGQSGWDQFITILYSIQYHPVWALRSGWSCAETRLEFCDVLHSHEYISEEFEERYQVTDPRW